jgi:hypothetical protein
MTNIDICVVARSHPTITITGLDAPFVFFTVITEFIVIDQVCATISTLPELVGATPIAAMDTYGAVIT